MKICILFNHLKSGSSLTRIYILDQNQFKRVIFLTKKRRVHEITPQRRIQNNQIKISENWPCELI